MKYIEMEKCCNKKSESQIFMEINDLDFCQSYCLFWSVVG